MEKVCLRNTLISFSSELQQRSALLSWSSGCIEQEPLGAAGQLPEHLSITAIFSLQSCKPCSTSAAHLQQPTCMKVPADQQNLKASESIILINDSPLSL